MGKVEGLLILGCVAAFVVVAVQFYLFLKVLRYISDTNKAMVKSWNQVARTVAAYLGARTTRSPDEVEQKEQP